MRLMVLEYEYICLALFSINDDEDCWLTCERQRGGDEKPLIDMRDDEANLYHSFIWIKNIWRDTIRHQNFGDFNRIF